MVSPLKQQHIKSLSNTVFDSGRKANGTELNSAATTVFEIPWQLGKKQERVIVHIRSELSYISAVEIRIRNYLLVDSSSLHWIRQNQSSQLGQQHNQLNKVALDPLTIKNLS